MNDYMVIFHDNKMRAEWIANLPDGEPCDHPGCLSHVSHPCEGCGRVAGKRISVNPSADNIIHIVAGNERQAKEFARRHGIYPKYWAFLSNPKDVRGLAGSVVYTGTFYQRTDIHEIEQEVKFNPRLKVLDTDG